MSDLTHNEEKYLNALFKSNGDKDEADKAFGGSRQLRHMYLKSLKEKGYITDVKKIVYFLKDFS